MAVVLPNVSKSAWLAALLAANTPLECRLYDNNVTPGNSTVIGDFNEASFAGYALQNLSFGTITINGSNKAQSVATELTFTLSAGTATIYGIFVTDSGGTLIFCAKFASAVSLSVGVPDLRVTVTLTEDTD